jgi:hypothetical protein
MSDGTVQKITINENSRITGLKLLFKTCNQGWHSMLIILVINPETWETDSLKAAIA